MATFGYTVIDKFGKEVKGTIETDSAEKARQNALSELNFICRLK